MNIDINSLTMKMYNKELSACTNEEIYLALLLKTKELAAECEPKEVKKRKLYYISAEFLIGRLLANNLINLGVYDDMKKQLKRANKDIALIEEVENEPSLGNGGLGRLAACFLDSIATLGLNGDGVGICYHFGLFKQVFENNMQTAVPDKWLTENSWLEKTERCYDVTFKGKTVKARMYDIAVTGYEGVTNKLHLFDAESVDETIVKEGIDFDKTAIEKNISLFLYPDDSDEDGRLLRIYQQYFMVSAAAQLIIDEALERGSNLHDLAEYVVIQINDTHPTMVIPELIRLLNLKKIELDEAIEIVSRCCAYTNHTILAEALEKWPLAYLKKAVPQLVPIIEILDDKVRRKFDDKKTAIIDSNDVVHMANLDIHYTFSTNGVAMLHTEILKHEELNHFYKIYPEKFNNKTNGITFRRFLMHANPELTKFLCEVIGEGWKKDATELIKLAQFRTHDRMLNRLLSIKQEKKIQLKDYLKATCDFDLNENSIFDIQIKRMHEYKRQQLNALYIIDKYLQIRRGRKPTTPITVIFGAKAAPAYTIAQDIIHLILCLQQIINSDKEVNSYLNVFMVENYNVGKAEMLIPACDISEQISLASKEASGTGNMKFMLNGAVTLGTEDGANVEIHQLVGDKNIYIFGDSSETVVERYKQASYVAKDYYQQSRRLKKVVDFITDKEMLAVGNKESLERLKNELINKDWFMTFPDFADYAKTRDKAYKDYENRRKWAQRMLLNIANAGFFSSDRTIAQYNEEIWKL